MMVTLVAPAHQGQIQMQNPTVLALPVGTLFVRVTKQHLEGSQFHYKDEVETAVREWLQMHKPYF
jgi:hypothetical protein